MASLLSSQQDDIIDILAAANRRQSRRLEIASVSFTVRTSNSTDEIKDSLLNSVRTGTLQDGLDASSSSILSGAQVDEDATESAIESTFVIGSPSPSPENGSDDDDVLFGVNGMQALVLSGAVLVIGIIATLLGWRCFYWCCCGSRTEPERKNMFSSVAPRESSTSTLHPFDGLTDTA